MRNDASAIQLEGTLPAPHDSIKLACSVYPWGVHLEYTGSVDQLFEAGCVTRRMVEICREPPRSGALRFVDDDGNHFARLKKPTRAQPDRVTIRRSILTPSSIAGAMDLPGVRAFFPDGLPACESTPSTSFENTVACRRDAVDVIRGRDFKPRHRPVGRFQRLVEWTAVEGVLYVNWGRVALDVGGAQDTRA